MPIGERRPTPDLDHEAFNKLAAELGTGAIYIEESERHIPVLRGERLYLIDLGIYDLQQEYWSTEHENTSSSVSCAPQAEHIAYELAGQVEDGESTGANAMYGSNISFQSVPTHCFCWSVSRPLPELLEHIQTELLAAWRRKALVRYRLDRVGHHRSLDRRGTFSGIAEAESDEDFLEPFVQKRRIAVAIASDAKARDRERKKNAIAELRAKEEERRAQIAADVQARQAARLAEIKAARVLRVGRDAELRRRRPKRTDLVCSACKKIFLPHDRKVGTPEGCWHNFCPHPEVPPPVEPEREYTSARHIFDAVVGEDVVVGEDDNGRAIYRYGNRRKDGIWVCPPAWAARTLPRADVESRGWPVGSFTSGCYQTARRIREESGSYRMPPWWVNISPGATGRQRVRPRNPGWHYS